MEKCGSHAALQRKQRGSRFSFLTWLATYGAAAFSFNISRCVEIPYALMKLNNLKKSVYFVKFTNHTNTILN